MYNYNREKQVKANNRLEYRRKHAKKWQAAVAKWHNTNYGEPKAEVGMILRDEKNKYDNDEELWK